MNHRHLNQLTITLAILATSASIAIAQSAPQFVARRDISLSGEIVVLAGELISTVSVENGKATMVLADGKRATVDRSELADVNEAVGVLSTLIQKDPKNSRLYSARANVWAVRNDFAKAIEDATRAIDVSDAEDATLHVNRGVFYASTGDYDKAVADYVKATEVDPKMYSAYRNLASAHVARQEFDKAVEVCTQLIKVNDDNAQHYIQRGVAYRHLTNWDAAIGDFSKALELDKNNLAALGSRGFVNYLKGDHAAAVNDFDAIIKLKPDDAMAYNNRGYNAFMSGDYKQALADYDKATSLLPAYAAAWQNKAWLLATCPQDDIRDGEAAIAAAKQATNYRQQKNASDVKALAAAYAETGNFEKAVEHQRSVIGLVGEDQKKDEESILAIYQEKKPYRTEPATATPTATPDAASNSDTKGE